jgi:hypothetical protein
MDAGVRRLDGRASHSRPLAADQQLFVIAAADKTVIIPARPPCIGSAIETLAQQRLDRAAHQRVVGVRRETDPRDGMNASLNTTSSSPASDSMSLIQTGGVFLDLVVQFEARGNSDDTVDTRVSDRCSVAAPLAVRDVLVVVLQNAREHVADRHRLPEVGLYCTRRSFTRCANARTSNRRGGLAVTPVPPAALRSRCAAFFARTPRRGRRWLPPRSTPRGSYSADTSRVRAPQRRRPPRSCAACLFPVP